MSRFDKPLVSCLVDIEDAIRSHPKETSELYRTCKAAFMNGQAEASANEWASEQGLTTADVRLIHEYLFAGAFVSAWHAVHNDSNSRNKAASSYCGVAAAAYGLPPQVVLNQFVQLEQLWHQTFAKKGIGRRSTIGCYFIIVFFFFVVFMWDYFKKK